MKTNAKYTATVKNLTDEQISRLRSEAGQAGDYVMGAICDLALNGSFDRDDYTALDGNEADRVAAMTREDAYAAIVDAINDAR